MKIDYEDEDLKELIETGQNKKYKKMSNDINREHIGNKQSRKPIK
jgi:hypothetical protein